MILIISESSDLSTNHVIEWIVSFGYPFIRVNPEDKIEIIALSLEDFTLRVNDDRLIRYSELTSVWFRRGKLSINQSKVDAGEDRFARYLQQHLGVEREAYLEYIYYLLSLKRNIGAMDKFHINKFEVLNKAVRCGFNVPSTVFTSSKEELAAHLAQHGELITKSSNYVLNFQYASESFMTYTERVNAENIADIPEQFAWSFCQALIKKTCDVRVFYLDGKCYSMAILSQKRKETEVDFRKYNYETPNRSVPFELPDSVRSKIVALMEMLELESGSIDLILDTEWQYHFLEVNPVGQFGMVDFPCNYSLNEKIARYLAFN